MYQAVMELLGQQAEWTGRGHCVEAGRRFTGRHTRAGVQVYQALGHGASYSPSLILPSIHWKMGVIVFIINRMRGWL